MSDPNTFHCTSCGKSQHEVRKMIAFGDGHFLCNECIDLMHEVAHDKHKLLPQDDEGGG